MIALGVGRNGDRMFGKRNARYYISFLQKKAKSKFIRRGMRFTHGRVGGVG